MVEDEESVRRACERILKAAGYEVDSVATPAEALAVYEERSRPYDVVLTDVVMPGMSGPELVEELRGTDSAVRTVFMSGYTEDLSGLQALSNAVFLNKPFTTEQLLQGIASCLRSAVTGEGQENLHQRQR